MENINNLSGAGKEPVFAFLEEEKAKNWKEKTKETIDKYTNEDSRLGKMAKTAVNQVDRLKKSDKLAWTEGVANMGYKIKETKARFLSGIYRDLAGATQENKFLSTFFGKHAGIYVEEWDRAEKARTGEKKDLGRLSGIGQGVGTMLRYGRVLYDNRFINPFRHVMAASMFIGKQSEALKETRFEYEGAKENTRVSDIDRAMEEAWDLYEAAQAKSGNKRVDAEELNKAYKDNLPEDIQKRFARGEGDYNGLNFIQKGMNRHMKWAAKRLIDKFDKIENSGLDPVEKARQKEGLLDQNRKLLNDLDAMVGDNAAIDTIAYAARAAEKTGKAVSTAMAVDSLYRFSKIAVEMGASIWDNIGPATALAQEKPDAFRAGTYYRIDQGTGRVISEETIDKGTGAKKIYYKIPPDDSGAKPLGMETRNAGPGASDDAFTHEDWRLEKYKVAGGQARIADREAISQAVVRRGEGVSHAIMRQLAGGDVESNSYQPDANHLKKMGYGGDPGDKKAIGDWARHRAGKIVYDEGYFDPKKNTQTWVMQPGRSAYILEGDEKSGFSVSEYHDRDNSGSFGSAEQEAEDKDSRDIDRPFEKSARIFNEPAVEASVAVETSVSDIPVASPEPVAETIPAGLDRPTGEMNDRFAQGIFHTEKQFGEEWQYLKDMPAKEAIFARVSMWGNSDAFAAYLKARGLGEGFVGNQIDGVELKNRIRLQELLFEANKKIGSPVDEETVGQYLNRYYSGEAGNRIGRHFSRIERVFSDSGAVPEGQALENLGLVDQEHSLAMVGLDINKDGNIDQIALMRAGDEAGGGLASSYDRTYQKPGEDFNAFRARAKSEFKFVIDSRLHNLDGYNLRPDEARLIGVEIFAKDNLTPLEEAKLEFARNYGKFEADKINRVFWLAEQNGYLGPADADYGRIFSRIGAVVKCLDNFDLSVNQRSGLAEMFFSDPKPGSESAAVLKSLFGRDDYEALGLKNPDISPTGQGDAVLNLDRYKVIVGSNGEAYIKEPVGLNKAWKKFDSRAIGELYKILQGQNKSIFSEDIPVGGRIVADDIPVGKMEIKDIPAGVKTEKIPK